MKVSSWYKEQEIELLPCPFCGKHPKMIHKGNDFSKKREIKIKCSELDCRCQMTNATLRHTFSWLEKISAQAWNKRI